MSVVLCEAAVTISDRRWETPLSSSGAFFFFDKKKNNNKEETKTCSLLTNCKAFLNVFVALRSAQCELSLFVDCQDNNFIMVQNVLFSL